MMKKHIYFLFAALATLAATSCGNNRFSIEGNLSDAGTQNLRAVYLSGDSIVSQWIPSVDGSFKIEGNSDKLTVVYIFTSQMKQIVRAAAKNGDKLAVSGSIADNYGITVDGTDINRSWSGFLKGHSAQFKAMETEKTDKAIAEFIRKNPESAVSTLLLTCDYSDPGSPEAIKLLESIADKAKPEQLTSLYGNFLTAAPAKNVGTLSLRNDKDSLELVNTGGQTLSLIYFWSIRNDGRKENVRELKGLSDEKRLKIIDICLDHDTLDWYATVAGDSAEWRHYKAIGGPVDKSVCDLNVKSSPFFIVSDSTGTQIYRGTSVKDAGKTVREKLKQTKR